MKKTAIFLFAALSFFAISSAYSQENITITTYYPAPMGVYENLRLFPTTTVPVCDVNNEGIMYYNNNTNLLMICRQVTTAPDTYEFQSASSLWTQIGSTGPNGADPIAIRPFDTNLKVGIGDIDIGWNRQNRLAVTDNTTTNGLGEQIALMEILNPRRGNSGNWSGGGDSVTALQLTPGQASWQVRADEFNSAIAQDSADAGAFMIHQTVNGNPATRLVIRNNGNVGIGVNNPQARLDVGGDGIIVPRNNADPAGVNGKMYYNTVSNKLRIFENGAWKNVVSGTQMQSGMYAGTGGWVTVNVGFRPKIVMILPLGEGPEAWSDNLNFKIADWPTSGTFPGTTLPFFANYIKDAEGYDNVDPPAMRAFGINILADGFKTNLSLPGRPYSWVAITWD